MCVRACVRVCVHVCVHVCVCYCVMSVFACVSHLYIDSTHTALPYLEKTTMFTVMSKFPFPRPSQMDTQLMEGRKKSLERFLKVCSHVKTC